MANILIPLPTLDFDPSEVSIPWKILTKYGHTVTFATPDGKTAQPDSLMLTGEGLDFWSLIPLLNKIKFIGLILRANKEARLAYSEMKLDIQFQNPIKWTEVNAKSFDAIVLPGGHRARGMCEYLESKILQDIIVEFFKDKKIVGAICHGVLLAARSINPETKKSVLFNLKTTALTWTLEKAAWSIARLSRFWDPNYYRTYLENSNEKIGYWSVEEEIKRNLKNASQFLNVNSDDIYFKYKTNGLSRDSETNSRPAFVVIDENFISARWPGDVHTFAKTICENIKNSII